MEEDILILPIDICRICTHVQSNQDIRTTKLDDEQVLMHEALEFVSCIRTDFNDGMSLTMCLTCSKRLSEAYKFKNQILDSYRTFYNQTSDFDFKKEDSIHDDDSLISIVEENSSMDYNEQENPALVKERANELGIKLSTDAASFLLEHNNYKTKNKQEPLSKEEEQRAEEASIEQIQTEENKPLLYLVDNMEKPSLEYETYIIETTEENELTKDHIQTEENYLTGMENQQADNTAALTSKNNKFLCHICHKTLPKKSNLRDHIRLHANEKNFVCSFCQKAFVQIANYQAHLRVHTKERPYSCHLCPKAYSQSSSLKTHIRLHTNERNYVCEVCNKAFTNSSDLDKHTRIHDLSRQFACETCGRLFAQKINLKVHERNVHFKKGNI